MRSTDVRFDDETVFEAVEVWVGDEVVDACRATTEAREACLERILGRELTVVEF
jgi:hypothetical protein